VLIQTVSRLVAAPGARTPGDVVGESARYPRPGEFPRGVSKRKITLHGASAMRSGRARNAKTLLELVRHGTFRADRHRALLAFDATILSALRSYHGGRFELSDAEFCRLDWCYWWQAQLALGRVSEEMGMLRFTEAVRGNHPSQPAPWPEDS
jgi:hypothetical protein